jgi:hypothetical protein
MTAAAAATTGAVCDKLSHGVIEALNRTKGFLGVSAEFAEIAPRDALTNIREMNNEVLFPLGIRALSDIADDLLVLDEIRSRFRSANGRPLMGYVSWKAFVEKNSKFSIRTVQRRLVAVNGIDESKVNHRFLVPLTPAQLKKAAFLKKHLPDLHQKVVAGRVTLRDTKRVTRQSRYSERDFYYRVGRCLHVVFATVDERLQEIVHIKRSDWCPEAEEGIKRLLLNLAEVSARADEYAAALKKVLKARKRC